MSNYLNKFERVTFDGAGMTVRGTGWKCKTCGWLAVYQGMLLAHQCPTDGIQQQCNHKWSKETPLDYKGRSGEMMQRICSVCQMRELRFTDGYGYIQAP